MMLQYFFLLLMILVAKEISCDSICDVHLYPSKYLLLSLHITSPPTLTLSPTKETVWRLDQHQGPHSYSIRVVGSSAPNLIGFYLCTNKAEDITLCEVNPTSVPPLWTIRPRNDSRITISVKKLSNDIDDSNDALALYAENKALRLTNDIKGDGVLWLADKVRDCDNVPFAKTLKRPTVVPLKKTDVCLSKTFSLFSKDAKSPCFSISTAAEIKLLLEMIFNIIDEIIEQNSFTSNTLIMQLIEDVELMLASLAKELHDGKSVKVDTRHIKAHLQKQKFPLIFPESNSADNIIVESSNKDDKVYPMVGALYQHSYNTDQELSVDNKTEKFYLNSKMIGAHVGATADKVRVRVSLNILKESRSKDGNTTVCAFWNTKGHHHHWATSGCRTVFVLDGAKQIICECNHLTNFALLTTVEAFQIPIIHKKILDTLSLICCCISIVFLTIGISIFLLLLYKEKKHRTRNAIHTNLMFSLWTAQLIFVLGIEATNNKTTCTAVAYLLHYFLLCSFSWMLVEGLFLYMNMIKVFVSAALHYLSTYMALAWVLPGIIVAITGTTSHKSYGTDAHCWLSNQDQAMWAFLAPMIFIITVNTVILVMVLYKIMRLQKMNDSIVMEVKVGLRSSLVLLPILGVTWVIGFANVNTDTLVFQYIFSIMNGLQGFMITLLHCFMNGDVKKSLKRIFKVWIRYYEVEKYFDVRRQTTSAARSQTLSTKVDSPALCRHAISERPLHSTWPGKENKDLTEKLVNIMNNQKEGRPQQLVPRSQPIPRAVHTSKVLVHPTLRPATKSGWKGNEESRELCGKLVSIMKHHQECKGSNF